MKKRIKRYTLQERKGSEVLNLFVMVDESKWKIKKIKILNQAKHTIKTFGYIEYLSFSKNYTIIH